MGPHHSIKRASALLLALAIGCSSTVQATPLDEIRTTQVSLLEFGIFKLEVALNGIKNWPFPIAGAGVSYKIDPDQIEVVIAVERLHADAFRTACAQTITRVREFLYVDAKGVAPMGRSYLNSYFRGAWLGIRREATLRAVDASTSIRVNVVGVGSCQAALIKAPVTFQQASPK